jgi:hypothetical protein
MKKEDYLKQPQTMVKFDPENPKHLEFLKYSKESMNHSVDETIEWLGGCGVVIEPEQC